MRISDWSSDVCSSDLVAKRRPSTQFTKMLVLLRYIAFGIKGGYGHSRREQNVVVSEECLHFAGKRTTLVLCRHVFEERNLSSVINHVAQQLTDKRHLRLGHVPKRIGKAGSK